jgi:uncharacterized protein YciI
MKYVLNYEASPEVLQKAPLQIAAHRELWFQFAEAGTLLMVGPFADPAQGAMAVFTTREAAEAFAQADPFVLNGVVSRWTIREWMEALVPE